MDIHMEVDLKSYVNKIFVPQMYRGDQGKIIGEKTEWPQHYPFYESFSSQERLDKAKEGWIQTGKVYHLLSRDENRNAVTHEYPEYFDGENRFIVVQEYDSFMLRRVRPMEWGYDEHNNLEYRSSSEYNLWADLTDLPQNVGQTVFDERILKDYIKQFFSKEMYPDQRYEKEPPILTEELANRNFALKQQNTHLEEDKARLEKEKQGLEAEKARMQKENEELRAQLQAAEQENRHLKQKIKVFNHFNEEKIQKANIFNLKKLKDKAKSLSD